MWLSVLYVTTANKIKTSTASTHNYTKKMLKRISKLLGFSFLFIDN